ncbi:MAG: zf-HC2 domain-containing protein [Desulfobacterales bacterium]|nr:zf-HC2 domain-containing protein [Desulfobacterales bacterium]
MDCAEIKSLLSEYIDGTLDEKSKEVVKHHLSLCKICRQECIALKNLVMELNSLESEKPPADFLEKVHQRIRSTSPLERVLRFLFLPLRLKVPLEVAAALVSVGLIFFVFHIQPPAKKIAEISKTFNAIELAEENRSDHVAPAFEEESIKAGPKLKTVGPQPFEKAEKGIDLVIYIRPILRSKSQRAVQSASNRAEEGERKKEGMESTAAEYETILVKVENLIKTLQGEVIYIEPKRQNRFPKEILVKLDRKHYSLLGEKLKQIVELQMPLPTLPNDNTPVIEIRIRIIAIK